MTAFDPPREPGPVSADDMIELFAALADPHAVEEVIAESALQSVRKLHRLGATLATAESLTGGLVGAAITSVPGSSSVYRGGVVAYASDLKSRLLDVDAGLLARVGAVDAEVAGSMAQGARFRLGADYGLATTGVAGPGPQDGNPPGTVWVGVATPTRIWEVNASVPADQATDRATVRRLTVMWALLNLGSAIDNEREDPAAPGR